MRPSNAPTATSFGLCPSATRGSGSFAKGDFSIKRTNAAPCSPIDRRATKASYIVIIDSTAVTENNGVKPSCANITVASEITTAV